MAKVSKKSEKITAFAGIFFVLDKFDRILSSVIDTASAHTRALTATAQACSPSNDWGMTDEEIIQHYNKRGTAPLGSCPNNTH